MVYKILDIPIMMDNISNGIQGNIPDKMNKIPSITHGISCQKSATPWKIRNVTCKMYKVPRKVQIPTETYKISDRICDNIPKFMHKNSR